MRGINFFRASYFLPNLIGGIVLGYIWQFVFNNVLIQITSKWGMMNSILANTKTAFARIVDIKSKHLRTVCQVTSHEIRNRSGTVCQRHIHIKLFERRRQCQEGTDRNCGGVSFSQLMANISAVVNNSNFNFWYAFGTSVIITVLSLVLLALFGGMPLQAHKGYP